ncbi:MAG: L-fucose/L-arabinose isomerase family protein [Victivallaceae bacterium]|nr:L-fucose/L-arabinose isomerase family protein [Victivallaceae bacterium]
MMRKFSVGYVALAKASWIIQDIETLRIRALENLKKLPFEIVHGNALTTTSREAAEICSKFRHKDVSAVILHFATFPVGAIIPVIVRELNVPVILFATPERPQKDGLWAQNSFCGANMAAHTLKKMGKKYEFVFGNAEEAGGLLKKSLNVLNSVSDLAHSKIGLVGGRVPGFYTSNCDEMRLRSSIGCELEIIDQLEIVNTASRLSDQEINKGVEEVRKNASAFCRTVNNDLELAGKMLQAFRKTAVKYGLSSYAVRCWPEWSDSYGIAPCAVIGILNNSGLIASCEGDVLGAVLMQAQASLAGCCPFFADLISFDKDSAVFWHCGAAPISLCRKFEDSEMRRHFRVDGGNKKGLVNEFPLKAGAITVAQLDEEGSGYRMLIAKGKAVETEQMIRGNPLNVKFEFPVEKLIGTIMNEGFKHHYSLVHADIAEELLSVCNWHGIKPVIVK